MASYKAPLRDMRFVLYELHDGEALVKLPGFEEFNRDLIDTVLEEAAKFCEEVLHPLNPSGDEEGCSFENGGVRTPTGFKEAYALYREGGWTGIAADPEVGGQGLPLSVNSLIQEMISSANQSFGMCPGQTHAAYEALLAHGSSELKQRFLPKMVAGIWSGTMCLTEPQCGTDLGLCNTKAIPQPDGSFRISGTKIFISAGEHDLTENIIHLVLARLPEAPPGAKGISLFLIPKFAVREDGSLGPRNGVICGAIEHKMGLKASPTCVMNFNEATGWLVGEPHRGMRAMFTMMNAERLAVGIQGVALAEASYQGAAAYARERLQGRSLSGPKYPEKPADPIIVHPDVRRMLLSMRATIEGCRALGAWVARALDIERRSPEPDIRQGAEDLVMLMTPVVKALFTDLGFAATNLGVQVLGGHGYIREHGMEQYVRDCRIAQIYEGTNSIQALDLLRRKLPAHGGRLLRQLLDPLRQALERRRDSSELAVFVKPLAEAFGRLQQATLRMTQTSTANIEQAAVVANEYLRLLGLVALGYMWLRTVEVALPKVATTADGDGFYRGKIATARFFFEYMLPETGTLFLTIMAGGMSVLDFPQAAF